MQLPISLQRRGYRLAYRMLLVYWFLARPAVLGVKCVLTDGDRLLLVRHTYGPPDWELPGGIVKRDEAPRAAARREMVEELGVTIDDWTPLGTVSAQLHHKRDTLHCFHAELREADLTLDRGEIEAAQWFNRRTLPAELGEYSQQIVGLLQRL